jgi:putative transposon-encoded protein
MTKLKLTRIGNSTGVISPKDFLHRMRIGKSDFVYATETQAGLELRVFDPWWGARYVCSQARLEPAALITPGSERRS